MAEIFKIAAASSDGIVVNRHFGHADTFYIYEANDDGTFKLLEKRELPAICTMGTHEDSALAQNINRLSDCRYILVSRIGAEAAAAVESAGITPMEIPGIIEQSIDKLIRYKRVNDLFA